MWEEEKALPTAGQAKPTQNAAAEETIVFEVDGRERWCLALTLGFCVLFVDTFLCYGLSWSGLGLGGTAAVLAWYGLVFAYVGKKPWARGESRFLLVVNVLLGLSLALGSNGYFKVWNFGALLLLAPLHAMALSGAALPWWRPAMLGERLRLLVQGLFGNLGAVKWTLGATEEQEKRRGLSVLLGVLAAGALLVLLIPVLASADALFAAATQSLVDFFRENLYEVLWKVVGGLVLTPFLFGVVYRIRRPRPLEKAALPQKARAGAEPVTAMLILGTLDALYLLFLGIQSTGLFGGADYLKAKGITYADWAREGFFQLVFVTAVNVAVTMAVLHWSRGDRGGKAVRLLATGLLGESFVLLCSAVWKMSLYVSAYGLSFKRCMTYWGMGVMAVFLGAALLKLWKKDFSFCRVAFFTAVCAWVAVSFVPVDYLVARDNVNRYLDGRSEVISITYLTYSLSYDALAELERLDPEKTISDYENWELGNDGNTLGAMLAQRRETAEWTCLRWETWNLSAWLAGRSA